MNPGPGTRGLFLGCRVSGLRRAASAASGLPPPARGYRRPGALKPVLAVDVGVHMRFESVVPAGVDTNDLIFDTHQGRLGRSQAREMTSAYFRSQMRGISAPVGEGQTGRCRRAGVGRKTVLFCTYPARGTQGSVVRSKGHSEYHPPPSVNSILCWINQFRESWAEARADPRGNHSCQPFLQCSRSHPQCQFVPFPCGSG